MTPLWLYNLYYCIHIRLLTSHLEHQRTFCLCNLVEVWANCKILKLWTNHGGCTIQNHLCDMKIIKRPNIYIVTRLILALVFQNCNFIAIKFLWKVMNFCFTILVTFSTMACWSIITVNVSLLYLSHNIWYQKIMNNLTFKMLLLLNFNVHHLIRSRSILYWKMLGPQHTEHSNLCKIFEKQRCHLLKCN